MKVVVMIPAYNEEKNISYVIKEIPRNFAKSVKILVIDDGSKDKTAVVAKSAGADKIVRQKINKGLGETFKTGLQTALAMGSDIIVNIDADGQFNPREIPKLVEPIVKKEADMVTCTRFSKKLITPKMPFIKKFGNNLFTTIINVMTNKRFTDTQCGFRAYSREAALKMNLFGRFTYTQEVFLELINKGLKIKEVPCVVRKRKEGKSKLVTNVFSYGINALLIIILTIRDNQPLKFFGIIGVSLFSAGFLSSLILFIRWSFIHKVNPYMVVVYIDIILIILGFLMIMLALIADMLERSRKIQEDILYKIKKKE